MVTEECNFTEPEVRPWCSLRRSLTARLRNGCRDGRDKGTESSRRWGEHPYDRLVAVGCRPRLRSSWLALRGSCLFSGPPRRAATHVDTDLGPGGPGRPLRDPWRTDRVAASRQPDRLDLLCHGGGARPALRGLRLRGLCPVRDGRRPSGSRAHGLADELALHGAGVHRAVPLVPTL